MKMSRKSQQFGVQIKQDNQLTWNENTEMMNFETPLVQPKFESSSYGNDGATYSDDNSATHGEIYEMKVKEQLSVYKQEPKQISEEIDIKFEPLPIKEEPKSIDIELYPEDEICLEKPEALMSNAEADDGLFNVKTNVKQEIVVVKEEHITTLEIDPLVQNCAPVQIKEEKNTRTQETQMPKVDKNVPKPKRRYRKKGDAKGNEKNHVCNSCGRTYAHEFYLTRHMFSHSGEKPFPCKTCDKKFVQKAHLVQHMRVHTGEKPYVCHLCENKAFNHKYNYKTHMRKHLGEPTQKCNLCSSVFHQKGDLQRHMRTHTGEKPFVCHICNASFRQNGHLTQHIRIHTKEKPYVCDLCKQAFAKKKHLTNHNITVHIGQEKRYPCLFEDCSKTFKTKSEEVNHSRIHSGVKPYSCYKCDKTFQQKGSLTTHTILAHEQETEDDLHAEHDDSSN